MSNDYELRAVIMDCKNKAYIDDRIHTWGKGAELKVWHECRGAIQELINSLNENPNRNIEEIINERINAPGLNGVLRIKTLKLVKEYLINKRYLKEVNLIE